MREFTRRMALSLPLAGTLLAKLGARAEAQTADTEWRNYGGDLASTRYSPLDQINADNFSKLEIAWRFKPDTFGRGPNMSWKSRRWWSRAGCTPPPASRRDVVALDAATGEMMWMYREDEGERGAATRRGNIPAVAWPIGPTARTNASSMSPSAIS